MRNAFDFHYISSLQLSLTTVNIPFTNVHFITTRVNDSYISKRAYIL